MPTTKTESTLSSRPASRITHTPEPKPTQKPTPTPRPTPNPTPIPIPELIPSPEARPTSIIPNPVLEGSEKNELLNLPTYPDSTEGNIINTETPLPTANILINIAKPTAEISLPLEPKPTSCDSSDAPITLQTDENNTEESNKDNPVFSESFGETRDVISGTRLRIMRETGSGMAQFAKQGVLLTFSDTALSAINIQDKDYFSVTIEKPVDDVVYFALEHNNILISATPDTQFMVSYQVKQKGAKLSLHNEDGAFVCDGSYDPALGVASFIVDSPGKYSIVESTEIAEFLENTEITEIIEEKLPAAAPEIVTKKPPNNNIAMITIVSAAPLIALGTGLLLYKRPGWTK